MNGEGRPVIVVPTIRSPEFFSGFLDDWKEEFAGCHLIVVEDRKKAIFRKLVKKHGEENGYTTQVFDHRDIDKDLGKDSWIISRKTDCVRNYGYLVAQRNNPLFIVTLDDDLKPNSKGHIQHFYNNLFNPVKQSANYFSTMNTIPPRGKLTGPSRKCMISHGAWVNVPDLDAKTQILFQGQLRTKERAFYKGYIPDGALYSMCGMNLAWRPEFTKYMYFPIQGKHNGAPVDRCGDIWAGYYSKVKADQENAAVYTGYPMVIHTRASNPWSNLKKEEGEDVYGREFLSYIVWESLRTNNPYWVKLKEAYNIWGRLIDEISNS